VLTILLDALRHDFITQEYCPFLSSVKEKAISGPLVPTFGFEPDAAYLAGLYPEECDGGMHYWFEPRNSLSCLKRFWSNRMPFGFQRYFDISSKRFPHEKDFISKKNTVFDVLRENKRPFFVNMYPVHPVGSTAVLQRVENELSKSFSFAFLHIADLDGTGHRYGPNSIEFKKVLQQLDARIAQIYKIMLERFEDIDLLILGDHGMAEVRQNIDIWSELKRLGLDIGRDYVFFLDSTMARFWFFNEKSKNRIEDFLTNFKQGHVVTEEEKLRHRINYSHNRFGDLIFLADPEMLIFPNFFQRKQPARGMHGYAPDFKDQQAAFLIQSSRIKSPEVSRDPVGMCRLFPTILDLLNMPVPGTCTVKSLL